MSSTILTADSLKALYQMGREARLTGSSLRMLMLQVLAALDQKLEDRGEDEKLNASWDEARTAIEAGYEEADSAPAPELAELRAEREEMLGRISRRP